MSIKKIILSSIVSSTMIAGYIITANAATLSGEVNFELSQDNHYHSSNKENEINNTYTKIELPTTLQINNSIALESNFVFEQVQDPENGKDSFLDNHGAFFEELKLTYQNGSWQAWGGKYNPSFGTAFDSGIIGGIWSKNFAGDYELTEKIGIGAGYVFEEKSVGNHALSLNTFFADTTDFSRSKITGRTSGNKRAVKSDGGASNNEALESYSITLDGNNVAGVEGLTYHAGYRFQNNGDVNIGSPDETGAALASSYLFPVTDSIKTRIFVEYVYLNNAENSNDDVTYLTTNLDTRFYKNWVLNLSHTSREFEHSNNTKTNDKLTQLSGGYDFDNGVSVQAGLKSVKESDVDTKTAGIMLNYNYGF